VSYRQKIGKDGKNELLGGKKAGEEQKNRKDEQEILEDPFKDKLIKILYK
jgi:hypothetical protein